MKTAHDLVLAARAQCQEVPLTEAEAAIREADLLIDVREPDEYAAGHLSGAVHIPRGMLEFKLSATPALEPRDLRIVLYCKTGGRAALSACSLQAMGYVNVRSLAGGYDAWVADNRAVVKPTPVSFD